MSIEQFKLNSSLIKYLKEKNIKDFSEVQNKIIPLLLKNKNVNVEAPTGSGKTLSFLLPIINSLETNSDNLEAIIFVPTRELGKQIISVLKEIKSFYNDFTFLDATGGKEFGKDLDKFSKSVNIIVGTPTRILKLFTSINKSLTNLKYIIIDEIDMIYNFGFLEEILLFKKNKIKKDDKTWGLFSASFSIPLQNFIKTRLQITQTNNIKIIDSKNQKIKINLISVNEDDKKEKLFKLITSDIFNPFFCLIFTKSNNEVNLVYKFLKENNIKDLYFFNNQLNSHEKNKTMKLITQEKVIFLVTTDLVARGIDFPFVTHIINYGYPKDLSFYKHRIGRTNRLNSSTGVIYDIFNKREDEFKLDKIKLKNPNLEFINFKF